MKLLLNALTKYLLGLLLVGALLFIPAGKWDYCGAWLLIALLFIPMLLLGIILLIKSPDLLQKRLNAKEKQSAQQGVLKFSALLFVGGFVIAGLDARFDWSNVSPTVQMVASLVFLISYALYAEVMRENAFLSRTIEIQEGQTVVQTGLYGLIRHPMYAVTLWLFLAIPLVLGSWWALIPFALFIPAFIVRIIDEEKLLTRELCGYAEYKQKVKYRLFPFIW